MVRGTRKWKSREGFIFSLFYLIGSEKIEEEKKKSLNKFIHIFLLKNYVKLKKKK